MRRRVGEDSLQIMISFTLAKWPFILCLIQISNSGKNVILIHEVAEYQISYNNFSVFNWFG